MIRWTGLAPWEFAFPFPGSLTSTFLVESNVSPHYFRRFSLLSLFLPVYMHSERGSVLEGSRLSIGPPTPPKATILCCCRSNPESELLLRKSLPSSRKEPPSVAFSRCSLQHPRLTSQRRTPSCASSALVLETAHVIHRPFGTPRSPPARPTSCLAADVADQGDMMEGKCRARRRCTAPPCQQHACERRFRGRKYTTMARQQRDWTHLRRPFSFADFGGRSITDRLLMP